VLKEPAVPVGWEIGWAILLGVVVKRITPAHGRNRTPVCESILTELIQLAIEYVCGKPFVERNEA
jgi:hypothetical protein